MQNALDKVKKLNEEMMKKSEEIDRL